MRNLEKDELEMAARRELMLSEGFRLFSEKGIESVSMQEVANACGIGIATLYRYYNTKLDLVLAIGTRQWEQYFAEANQRRTAKHPETLTAAQRLDFYLSFYIDMYKEHKALLRFNQNFNNYVRNEGATKEQLAPYTAAIGEMRVPFHELYEQGKSDGTIRTDISEDRLFAATSHIMLAVAVRYAQGLVYLAQNEADRTEEFDLLKRMILREFVVEHPPDGSSCFFGQ